MPRLHVLLRAFFWTALYLLLALLPLSLAMLGERPEGRGFWIELGVGLGLVGYVMLGLQFATTSRFGWVMPYFGTDAEVRFHRIAAMLAVGFVLLHPVVLFLANSEFLDFLNPWSNLPRAVSLVVVVIALVLLIVLSLWRLTFRLNYEWWRLSHGGLAVLVILIGLAHGLQVEHYVSGFWKRAAWVIAAVIPLGLWGISRGVKPLRFARQPWKVVEVHPESPDVHRLVLEPDGHSGIHFRAGQYAWLTVNESPWTLQQHPFSFLSSDQSPDRVEFGIKALGDFTETVGDISPGKRAYLEGPYGSFRIDSDADGAIFIVGGIGVTPVMSILKSCRDRMDSRPFWLLYANPSWEEIPFRKELERIARDFRLTIVHVLESPPDGWQGETGIVTKELLERQIAKTSLENPRYLTCGPDPMMDVVEASLIQLGVPHFRFVSERFAWV